MLILHFFYGFKVYSILSLFILRTILVEGVLITSSLFLLRKLLMKPIFSLKDVEIKTAILYAFYPLIPTFLLYILISILNISNDFLIPELEYSIVAIVCIGIISIFIHSIVEEFYFRFILLEGLRKSNVSVEQAVWIQAILFMLWHWYMGIAIGFPLALVMGFLLGKFIIRTGNLANVIISHATLNLLLVFSSFAPIII